MLDYKVFCFSCIVISVDVAMHVGCYMITRKVLLTVQMRLQLYLNVIVPVDGMIIAVKTTVPRKADGDETPVVGAT